MRVGIVLLLSPISLLLWSCANPQEIAAIEQPQAQSTAAASVTASGFDSGLRYATATPTFSEVELTRNAVPTHPPLSTPIATPVVFEDGYLLYAFLFQSGLRVYSIGPTTGQATLSPLSAYELAGGAANSNNTGPGQAFAIAFARSSPVVAYWIIGQPGRLWLSSLDMSEQKIIFEDMAEEYPNNPQNYGRTQLTWIMNDKFLLLDVYERPELTLLYSVETDSTTSFPYLCDRVALSPKTETPSLWCLGIDGHPGYLVLEPNGELWQSTSEPSEVIASQPSEGFTEWDWMASGQFVYFDYTRGSGQLAVLDGGRTRHLPILGFANFATKNLIRLSVWYYSMPTVASSGGISPRVLVYGQPLEPSICPPLKIADTVFEEGPCWLVVDIETGQIVWSISDLLNLPEFALSVGIDINGFSPPKLSRDGELLVTYDLFYNDSTYVISLDTQQVISYFQNYSEAYHIYKP
ncbi:MAG: hypothetical protein HYZ26_09770 [Chloroflexi bacterium]|nr:hypothetical protein [Chloroflexota bacterium]